MITFTIKIAGKKIGITTPSERTRLYCQDYLTSEQPDWSVTISSEDIESEKALVRRNNARKGTTPPPFTDQYLEVIALYRKIAERMLRDDTLLFHGSVIAVDGEAYLFTAASGTGKSTHTRLWRQIFGDRAVMVNDDKPLLTITKSGVTASGTPWCGKHRLSTNITVPLKAICILERGQENKIEPISASQALPMLLQECHRPEAPDKLVRLLDLLDQMISKVALYRLQCNMEPEAAIVAYSGMGGKNCETENWICKP